MSLTYGFYNSLNGDRRYTAEQLSRIFSGVINDGVFMSIGEHLKVSASNKMTVIVGSGRAWFNGTWTDNDTNYNVTIPVSELVLNRIDAVVLEINTRELVRANSIKVISGTPATSPSKPTLTNSDGLYQYPLAYITVKANATSISQSDISNAVGTSRCPWVTGILETVDTDELITQWETRFNEIFAQLETAIEQTISGEIVDGSIITPKIADGAVTGDKIDPAYTRAIGNSHNMLVNSDFCNLVNQRGQASYKGTGYGIDRWTCSHSKWNVAVGDGCVRFYTSQLNSATGMLRQYLELTPNIIGKQVTLAARVRGDYVRVNINNVAFPSTSLYYTNPTEWTTLIATGEIQPNQDTGDFFVAVQSNKGANVESFECQWIALYEGTYTADTLPEYRPKGYENELLVCKQYDPTTGEYIGLGRFDYAPNLLDNGDFENLVAQAGIMGSHGSTTYFADRWRVAGQQPTYDATSRTLSFPSSGTGMIEQVIAGSISGKTVTLAIKASKVTGTVRLSENGAQSGHDDILVQKGITTHTFVAEDGMKVLLWSPGSSSLCIDWIALYEGAYTAETLPGYRAKGYGAELAECQRYYLHDIGQCLSGSFMSGSNSFRVTVPLPVTMRVTPTVTLRVTLISGDSIVWAYDGKSGTVPVTGASVAMVNSACVVINLTTSSNPGAYVSGHTFTTRLSLHADL